MFALSNERDIEFVKDDMSSL